MRPSTYEIPILPEQLYSVCQAARYFGVHRCTIYDYLHHPTRPLPYLRSSRNGRTIFLGQTLIEYKQMGLPKKGRKRL